MRQYEYTCPKCRFAFQDFVDWRDGGVAFVKCPSCRRYSPSAQFAVVEESGSVEGAGPAPGKGKESV